MATDLAIKKSFSESSMFVDEEEFEFLDFFDEEDDDDDDLGRSLLGWELVDASDAEPRDQEPEEPEPPEGDEESGARNNGSETKPEEVRRFLAQLYYSHHGRFVDDGGDDGQDDEDDHDEARDLNDELVPWTAVDKLGRQRIRKQCKRGFSKAQSANKSPRLAKSSGVVRGKRSSGVKHSL